MLSNIHTAEVPDFDGRGVNPPAQADSSPQGSPLRFHDRQSSFEISRKPLPPTYNPAGTQGVLASSQNTTQSENTPPRTTSAQQPLAHKPNPAESQISESSPQDPKPHSMEPQITQITHNTGSGSQDLKARDIEPFNRTDNSPTPAAQSLPFRQKYTTHVAELVQQPQMAVISSVDSQRSDSPRDDIIYEDELVSRHSSQGSGDSNRAPAKIYPQLQYHHQQFVESPPRNGEQQGASNGTGQSSGSSVSSGGAEPSRHLNLPGVNQTNRRSRPASSYSTLSDMPRGRSSPSTLGVATHHARARSAHSSTSDYGKRASYIDLNLPYPQPPPATFDNSHLRTVVGSNASLLSQKQTLEMYRANAKKSSDPSMQYEFAIFMIAAAQEMPENGTPTRQQSPMVPSPGRDLESPSVDNSTSATTKADLLREARHILQRLADRSYPYAQYYLADAYASGLFNKGKEDNDKAFGLFVAASKHGHAEAGYRAGLCYEFGWGCRKDPAKAVQFYRQSASKNHPGAMLRLGRACLYNDLGMGVRYREGITWMKRATESADEQYPSAPYELGVLHETGYGDDVFQDQSYAAQLFTHAAELGHAQANYRLGDAYEHGKLNCPRDAALSVHFYTGAAQAGHAGAMMALCAWYLVGAEPVLQKDENEAYEWARRAGELGLAKAEYAVGYFTEMGIGCRRDPLEANVWYVKAADQGDERAKQRLANIQAAASGETVAPSGKGKMRKNNPNSAAGGPAGTTAGKDDKECILM